jgi:type II secretory pathway component PulF
MLFDVGPRFQELYIGFGVELPVVTIWALRVLHFTLHDGIFLIANLIGLGVVGGISFFEAHRQQETRQSARFYALIANSLVGLLMVLFTAAIVLPFPRLLEALS